MLANIFVGKFEFISGPSGMIELNIDHYIEQLQKIFLKSHK